MSKHSTNAPHAAFNDWRQEVSQDLLHLGIAAETVEAMLECFRVLALDLFSERVPATRASRVLWDETLHDCLEKKDITRSDAQAITEARENVVDEMYRIGASPYAAAQILVPPQGEQAHLVSATGPNVEWLMRSLFDAISEEEAALVIACLTAVQPHTEAAQERCENYLRSGGAIHEATRMTKTYAVSPVDEIQRLVVDALASDDALRAHAGTLRR